MNPRFKNLNRIEFSVTYSCPGRCIHCSEAGKGSEEHILGEAGARAVKRLAGIYDIKSLMCFGGEPLLYPDDTFKIFSAGRDSHIPIIQIITNGCFSRSDKVIEKTAYGLSESGCNNVLISADAFHQKNLPLETVMKFGILISSLLPGSVKVSPAWIKGPDGDNPYDKKTAEIIKKFNDIGIPSGKGNIIFPAGNAIKYLGEYFDPDKTYINPYEEDPTDIKTVSINPDGSLLGGNIYQDDAAEILENYRE